MRKMTMSILHGKADAGAIDAMLGGVPHHCQVKWIRYLDICYQGRHTVAATKACCFLRWHVLTQQATHKPPRTIAQRKARKARK